MTTPLLFALNATSLPTRPPLGLANVVLHFFKVIANALLLVGANLIGYYYQFMNSQSQQRTFEQIRSTVESRVKLECEKEHQEQLLLSVIPAYIAAEVRNWISLRLSDLMPFHYLGEAKYHASNG